MNPIISISPGFQYSVNIGFDLNNDDKLRNFIPTQSALVLLEDILLSTRHTGTDRARVLIGAYGKGKSHIVLTILSMLRKKDLALFEKLMAKVQENPRLLQYINSYYESSERILPVVITGSSTSLSQAFILALQRTLTEQGMLDIMPETNYLAAAETIDMWEKEYPDTYKRLSEFINMPVRRFRAELEEFNTEVYEQFEKVYPQLTSGSIFNPFLGFDVVQLYESAAKGMKARGYTGIFVVYDEFSKYLESNITDASVSDTKMLQDFAEKCNRSGELQMHIMLISHKEISNYIDKLPKEKVDGWRGVSERFKHIHLYNNFAQVYEIISSVINKGAEWENFCLEHEEQFNSLFKDYSSGALLSDIPESIRASSIQNCFPLHPVSMFILPRLSERIAQNERTLFTFLSADGTSTLNEFLIKNGVEHFRLVTPDIIYDYFEPLLRKEIYQEEIHNTFKLTSIILAQLEENSFESRIVKTISLIYMLGQFERLKPTRDEIVRIYSTEFTSETIHEAINDLIDKKFLIYLKRSNHYLQLKQSSGVDIRVQIQNASQQTKKSVKETLNSANFDNYMYPSRYNDEYEMTRYFSFEFVDETDVMQTHDWNARVAGTAADGVIFGVIPANESSAHEIEERIIAASAGVPQAIFAVPHSFKEIDGIVNEYNAVRKLLKDAENDRVLFDEYEVIYEDLQAVINDYISAYTHPEKHSVSYIHSGQVCHITRKAALTEKMSEICCDTFPSTPVIINEALNRNDLTSVSFNSRKKIIAGLLRNELEKNLGLTGTGQDVSIMRSTLIRTGVITETEEIPKINLKPDDEKMSHLLEEIGDFVREGFGVENADFGLLYDRLMSPQNHIGLRKGLIPIYLAAVLHEYKQNVIISDRFGSLLINADTLTYIDENPSEHFISYMDWNPEKQEFVQRLSTLFADYIKNEEKAVNSYEYVANAIRRWYLALPKYSRESKKDPDGNEIDRQYTVMIKLLRQNISAYELLFEKLPQAFDTPANEGLADNISETKVFYDELFVRLKLRLIKEVRKLFLLPGHHAPMHQMSFTSVIRDWCDSLDPAVFEHLFVDGTDRCLGLFKTVTNDEETFIVRLAKLATDLRLEDWDESCHARFLETLARYKTNY